MSSLPKRLDEIIFERVRDRTGRRVADLRVSIDGDRIVLHGRSKSFYVKQLALQGVRDFLPRVELTNAIVVEEYCATTI